MANELTAFLYDADSRRVVRQTDQKAEIRRGTVRTAAQAYQTKASSDVMLVDLDGEQNPMVHVAELLRVCRPETVVIATGSENNVSLANDLYRGGVFLYLPKPLDSTDIRRSLGEIEAAQDERARPEIQTSRLVLVHGKGMGRTTVTALLARLAAERGRYVTCLDLDAAFGTLALALDTQPERGLAQALNEPVDELSLDRLHTQVSSRISLLAHPFDQAGQPQDGERSLQDLVSALGAHAHLILTTGATLAQLETLRHIVTNHVIVFEPTPAGLSVATRWLRILRGATASIVMNETRPLGQLLNPEHINQSLGDRPPDARIPYIRSMPRAMALGEPERAITKRERGEFAKVLNPLVGLGAANEDG